MTRVRRPSWIRQVLTVAGLLAMALGTWLSFPTTERDSPTAAPMRAVLFDVSAGTTRLRPAYGIWARRRLREEALAALAAKEELALGMYAADVRHLGQEPAQDWLARLEGRGGQALRLAMDGTASIGSELDAGIALFEAELSRAQRPASKLVIYAARDYSGADPTQRLARLSDAGVQIEWKPLPAPTRIDLALEGIDLPQDPEPGAALVGRFHIALATAGKSRRELARSKLLSLAISQQSDAATVARTVELELPQVFSESDGYSRWSVRLDLGRLSPGVTRLVARALLQDVESAAEGDPIPENDQRAAECRAGAVKLVAAVASAERLDQLRAWIGEDEQRWPGLQFSFVEPAGLAAQLGQLDLILSFDLAPLDMPRSLVTEFVRGGGSWFFCGGWGCLPGWAKRPHQPLTNTLGELLPLEPEPEGAGPRDVIFLVDGSGSMAGGPFGRVRRALADLIQVVGENDGLWLRFFTGSLMAPIDLRIGQDGPVETLQRLFNSRVPRGPTAILYSLDQLVAERAEADRPALTFLLSDGRDDVSHNVESRGPQIAAGLSQGESRLVVVAAGGDPDRQLLEFLVPPGGTLLESGKMGDLSELFQREIFRSRVREGSLALRPAADGALPQTRELLEAWGTGEESWPLHSRYLRCQARPGADVLLRSAEHGEPIVALWRVGTGLVCAWASSTQSDWAPDFRDADALFAPLLRILARRPDRPRASHLESRGSRLVLSGVPTDWPAQVRAEIHAQVWGEGPGRPAVDEVLGEATLWPEAAFAGADPRTRRAGPLPPALGQGVHARPLQVLLRGVPGGELLGQVGLQLACPPEFEPRGARRLTDQGSSDLPGSRAARARRERSPAPRAWIWLVLGLVALAAAALLGALESDPGDETGPNSPFGDQAPVR